MRKTWDYIKIVKQFGYTEYKDPNNHKIQSVVPWNNLWEDLYLGKDCIDVETNQPTKYNKQFTTIFKKPMNKTTFQNWQHLQNSQYKRIVFSNNPFIQDYSPYPKSRSLR